MQIHVLRQPNQVRGWPKSSRSIMHPRVSAVSNPSFDLPSRFVAVFPHTASKHAVQEDIRLSYHSPASALVIATCCKGACRMNSDLCAHLWLYLVPANVNLVKPTLNPSLQHKPVLPPVCAYVCAYVCVLQTNVPQKRLD